MSIKAILRLIGLVVCFYPSLSRKLQKNEAARSLNFSYVPEFDDYPIGETRFSHVISIRAPTAVDEAERAPVSITAVLDRSGSMAGGKLTLLKKSTEFLVESLREGDYFGVVSYSRHVTEDSRLSPITIKSKRLTRNRIKRIEAGGTTNLSGGLFKGVKQQTQGDVSSGSIKTVILFTDGLANAGNTRISSISSKLAQQRGNATTPTIYPVGVGADHDVEFLQEIAKAGHGSYVFIKEETDLAASFGEIIGGLLTITAQNIKITLVPAEGTSILSVKGGDVFPSSSVWMTAFPDLFAEEIRDILVDMKIPQASSAGSQIVLSVKIEYYNTILATTVVKNIDIRASRGAGQVPSISPAAKFEITKLRFQTAEDIAESVKARNVGDYDAATSILDRALEALKASNQTDSKEIQALVKDAQRVRDQVSEEADWDTATAQSLAAGAHSISSQRVLSSSSNTFQSTSATSYQLSSAIAADNFVGAD